ncbi:hypothetical protein BSR29_05650 [Boudabousia liubingyangii]|uniref:VIT family protein n=1 Tax=Boudabousia liubingyangii TaxID=1921764 RepID=A0A1Q5PLN0_9ACTO|nr:VIT family protein [Boudabousia liubingyangii]OKL46926.1 hypothetical protein BSR28_05750 [Boudabousia liubingyangii]OKL47964.1 hypothetical protein BSR29_05650 [Boudabousia liubingyangii]
MPTLEHLKEAHSSSHASKLNWLRAGVLGANDGIVSVAALLLAIIGAQASTSTIITAGIASLVAGAVSMALGEYVSVSAQRDSEKFLIAKEKWELEELPKEEHEELKQIFMSYGMSEATAEQAVSEVESGNPLPVHLRLELGIDGEELTSPWAAAGSSALSFTLGAALPLLAAVLAPTSVQAVVVVAVTLATLGLTGWISAKLSETDPGRAVVRLVIGGALGLALTYGAGVLFGGM